MQMQLDSRSRWKSVVLLFAVATVAVPTPADAAVLIGGISPSAVARSGRLIISGTGFGTIQGPGQVLVDGVPAPVTHWSDSAITAYILGSTPLGSASLSITNGVGESSSFPIEVLAREAAHPSIRAASGSSACSSKGASTSWC